MTGPLLTEHASPAAQNAGPWLTVAIPFRGDDPRALLDALAAQANAETEIVLLDDGTPDWTVSEAIARALPGQSAAVRLIVSKINLGRSAGRNRLAAAARGDWVLFLDADMSVEDGFLDRWRAALAPETSGAEFDAAFGGYTLPERIARDHRVHAGLARAGDVHDAAARSKIGATAVCASNLAVRASLMADCPFDEGYRGWGWEDVDWAVRAAAAGRMAHIDNPARHGGMQPVARLKAKFAEGGVNYARFLERHPQMAALPGAKTAHALRRLKLAGPIKTVSGAMSEAAALPVRARVLALKLYKAACAAQAMEDPTMEHTR